ncbi:MAG: dicarboxylate/amino acid:cation symporter, partial [Gammaproteobacteria bacterium]|nr:dicarboxylate/amino acid:cation symporter [Gammaproteobacteria bacterium]
MMTNQLNANQHRFTIQIIIGMLLGVLFGLLLRWLPLPVSIRVFIVSQVLHTGGTLFINLLKMMVVPVVFVSLVLGCSGLKNPSQLGRVGGRAFLFYIITTVIAVSLALIIAKAFGIGKGLELTVQQNFRQPSPPDMQSVITGIVPVNPLMSLVSSHMLQIIFFALFFGMVIISLPKISKSMSNAFEALNAVFIKMTILIIKLAPIGVFFLLAELFAKIGFGLIRHLLGYFFLVLLVLAVQMVVVYSVCV